MLKVFIIFNASECTLKHTFSHFKVQILYANFNVHKNLISDPTLHNHNPDDNTHLNRQKLSNAASRKSLSDFSIRPSKIFLQMFTIHGLINDYYIPLAFFLLPDKETQTYIKAFTHLSEECLKRGLIFSPDTVFADFEISIHTAVQKVWLHLRLKDVVFTWPNPGKT